MNTKLHAVADANGRPLSFFMTAGQISDYTGAAALLAIFQKRSGCSTIAATTPTGSETLFRPKASSPAFRAAGRATSRSGTTSAVTGVAAASRSCFGRLKDRRRNATRYDRCPTAFFAAVALAATVIFWL